MGSALTARGYVCRRLDTEVQAQAYVGLGGPDAKQSLRAEALRVRRASFNITYHSVGILV